MAPLNVGALVASLDIIAVPVFPASTVIGFAIIPVKLPDNIAVLLPLESPSIIGPVPKAAATLPNTVPDLIVTPLEKVLVPDNANCEVELFWMTPPVTLVPMTEEMVVSPVPEPELVTEPPLLRELVWIVIPPEEFALSVRFWLPVIPPDIIHNPDPDELKVFILEFRTIAPLMVRGEVLVWDIPVTLAPIAEDIVTVPEPEPELVMVPLLFTEFVETVKLPVLFALNVRF